MWRGSFSPHFDDQARRVQQWETLIADQASREMESGLVRLVGTLLSRMHVLLGRPAMPQLMEYVLNNATAWTFADLPGENDEERERARREWQTHISTLDTAILSLIGESEIPDDAIASTLDDILQSSLWERRLRSKTSEKRGKHSRQVCLLAPNISGVDPQQSAGEAIFWLESGLETGHALDAGAAELNELLVNANGAMLPLNHRFSHCDYNQSSRTCLRNCPIHSGHLARELAEPPA